MILARYAPLIVVTLFLGMLLSLEAGRAWAFAAARATPRRQGAG